MDNYVQGELFQMETVTLTDIRKFISQSMQGYGIEGSCFKIEGSWINETYIIGGFKIHGTKDEREACHNAFLIDIGKNGKGKCVVMLDGMITLHSGRYTLEFIRKLDRCRCFDEFTIDMEGLQNRKPRTKDKDIESEEGGFD